jgi:hypothetical protein
VSALAFGWKYPLFSWGVFKAKYMIPAMLWIPYAALVPLSEFTLVPHGFWRRSIASLAILALLVFVFVNHWLPVY